MKRDPDRHREWQERSRQKAATRAREKGRSPLRQRGKKYTLKQKRAFAGQAEWCRHHPCAACHPELYTEDLLALEHYSEVRISDPHHTVAGQGRQDRDCIPLCRRHHRLCSAVNSTERDVQRDCGLNFIQVAAIIHREISGNVEHYQGG